MNLVKLGWKLMQMRGNASTSPEKLKQLQERQLRRLLKHAADHSPYYAQAFKTAGISKEQLDLIPLSALPSINKTEFLRHFDELVTDPRLNQTALRQFDEQTNPTQALFLNQYHVVHSSGSTQIPGYFVYDKQAWETMLAGILRAALWGMTSGQIIQLLQRRPRILYIAATDGRYGGAMAVGAGIEGVHARQLFLDIQTPLAQWIEQIGAFQPEMVIGYPSAIKILGELVESRQLSVSLTRIISCGEPLNPGMRRYLTQTLKAEVINFYGASESLALGVEAAEDQGMRLFDDMNIIEVENGKMFLTCLYNTVQPLIRYELSDQLTLRNEKSDRCPFTQSEIVLGRSEDLMWFTDQNGRREFLHPLAVEGFCVVGLRDYQFCQTAPDAFEMICETSQSDHQQRILYELHKQLSAILAAKHLEFVHFRIRFIPRIPTDPKTGKKRLILKEEFDEA